MNSPLTGAAAARVGPVLPAGDPRIVGIVNITEDSFSDGGRYLDSEAAIVQAHRLRGEGADVVELGPAASHPGSAPVTAAEEQRRLASVLEQLAADGIPVSVDSSRPQTQRFAIAAGVAYLNDIHGFADPDMYPALAGAGCQLIVMHAIQAAGSATRVVTDSAAVWDGTLRFFAERLAALREAGISGDRLVIDPGLGYFLGSTPGPGGYRPRGRNVARCPLMAIARSAGHPIWDFISSHMGFHKSRFAGTSWWPAPVSPGRLAHENRGFGKRYLFRFPRTRFHLKGIRSSGYLVIHLLSCENSLLMAARCCSQVGSCSVALVTASKASGSQVRVPSVTTR